MVFLFSNTPCWSLAGSTHNPPLTIVMVTFYFYIGFWWVLAKRDTFVPITCWALQPSIPFKNVPIQPSMNPSQALMDLRLLLNKPLMTSDLTKLQIRWFSLDVKQLLKHLKAFPAGASDCLFNCGLKQRQDVLLKPQPANRPPPQQLRQQNF